MDWPYARHVEHLATTLFDQLRGLHGGGVFEQTVLSSAALLHDVGVAIDFYNHDEHSSYLIMNAELPGFTHREIALMALLARHHRRDSPDVAPFKGLLTPEDEDRVEKLSALLRLAEYLDRSRTQVIHSLTCRVQPRAVQLICHTHGDASTEVWSTPSHADLFQEVFKREVIIQTRPIKAARAATHVIDANRAATPEADPLWTRVREIMRLLRVA